MEGTPVVNLASNAADGGLVANVSCSESSRSQPSNMRAKFGDDRPFSHPRSLDCRGYPGSRATINADIRLNDLARQQAPGRKENQEEESGHLWQRPVYRNQSSRGRVLRCMP